MIALHTKNELVSVNLYNKFYDYAHQFLQPSLTASFIVEEMP